MSNLLSAEQVQLNPFPSFTVNLTPYWPNTPSTPNTILNITYYTTSAFQYSASITGPGITSPIAFTGNSNQFSSILIPSSLYVPGQTMPYIVTISSSSPTLIGQVQNSMEIGTKPPNGVAITYQGFLFTNDGGSDNDWNDCVVCLALFNSSTDN